MTTPISLYLYDKKRYLKKDTIPFSLFNKERINTRIL